MKLSGTQSTVERTGEADRARHRGFVIFNVLAGDPGCVAERYAEMQAFRAGGHVMGAWGYGILQNDPAQDSICEVAIRIEADVAGLSIECNEENAAKAGAAIG